jgi:hypothetical protein
MPKKEMPPKRELTSRQRTILEYVASKTTVPLAVILEMFPMTIEEAIEEIDQIRNDENSRLLMFSAGQKSVTATASAKVFLKKK